MVKIKKLPSGAYNALVYDYTDDNGKRIYKSFTADTEIEVEKLVSEFKYNKKRLSRPENLTVPEAVERYIVKSEVILSPSTVCGYRRILRNNLAPFNKLSLENVTLNKLQKQLNDDALIYSPKTLRNIYGLLMTVLRDYMPDRRFSLKYPPKQKIISELPSPLSVYLAVKGSPVELPVMLAMWLSLRMSEIRGLRREDITGDYLIVRNTMLDTDNGTVFRTGTKTYSSTRRLNIPPYIKNLIDSTDTEFIVPATASSITKRFSTLLRKANIQHIRFHDLRHINASVMVKLGIPNKYAMERGGWSSDDVLKAVYQHTFSDERINVDKKVDDYFESIIK